MTTPDVSGELEAATQRVRELGEQVAEQARKNGLAWLEGYETVLKNMLDLEEQAAKGTGAEWATTLATTHANFVRSTSEVVLGAMRQQLKEVGRQLADAGTIDHVHDVFFLDLGDARRGLAGENLRALVAERREAYEQELKRRHIPRLLLSDGTEPEAVAVETVRTDGALAGSPASAGTVTGRARVVLDPVGAHLEPGEILVAPSTDPGWTPLFLTAGGLVMEMGGSNSHGAVVAREYGIPAVVGVPEATHKIETGQLITVDGAAGLVTLAANAYVGSTSSEVRRSR